MYGIAADVMIQVIPMNIVNVKASWKNTIPNKTPKTISNSPRIPAVPASIFFSPLIKSNEGRSELSAKSIRKSQCISALNSGKGSLRKNTMGILEIIVAPHERIVTWEGR